MTEPDLSPLLAELETWLRARSLAELLPREELLAELRRVRGDDAFWARQEPRYRAAWASAEERLRSEARPVQTFLSAGARARLIEAVEAVEPDPEAVRTFLRTPAVEAMLGEVLFNGISEFLRRVDLLGPIVDRLPILGGIRRRILSTFKEELEGPLEAQVKSFLGTFSGRGVERMIQHVLAPEHRAGFKEARRRVAEHLLARPVKSLLPAADSTARWRDQLWGTLREPMPDEEALLERFYQAEGQRPLGERLFELTPAGRELLARALGRFFSSEPGRGWELRRA